MLNRIEYGDRTKALYSAAEPAKSARYSVVPKPEFGDLDMEDYQVTMPEQLVRFLKEEGAPFDEKSG